MMNSFKTRRRGTPFFVWPLILVSFYPFCWSVSHFEAIDYLLNENGFFLSLFLLSIPFLQTYAWSKKFNLFSTNDLTFEIDTTGLYVRNGKEFIVYGWEDVHMVKIMEIMTPAGHFKYLRYWTINYMHDKRHDTIRRYYTRHEIYFYGFDRTEEEVMHAYYTLRQTN